MQIRAVFFDMGGTLQTYGYDRALRLQATPGLRRLLVNAGINLPLDDDQLEELVSSGLDRYKRWSITSLVELPSCAVWQEYILSDYQVDPGRLETVAEDLTFYVETRYYRRAMRPEILEQLARTLQILADEGPPNLSVEALWVGEAPSETTRVTSSELVELVRSSRLGTRTRYELAPSGRALT